MQDDSIDGIYDTLKQTAKFLNLLQVEDFLYTMFVQQVPYSMEQMERQMVLFLLRVFNDTARYVDQGGGSVKVVLLSTSKLGMHADVLIS
jgi:ribonucleoside-diphosphate reductase alpha chain